MRCLLKPVCAAESHVEWLSFDDSDIAAAAADGKMAPVDGKMAPVDGKMAPVDGDELESALEDIVIVLMVLFTTASAYTATARHADKRPQYRPPGIPTTLYDPENGKNMVRLILEGPEQYCFDTTRLKRPVLIGLIRMLVDDYGLTEDLRTKVSPEQQVIIFLHHCGHNMAYRQLRMNWQHSLRQITRYIHRVSLLLCRLALVNIRPPGGRTPQQILESDKAYPYLKGCVGALDGTYIPARLRGMDPSPFRNRKGFISQNVLAACDFDMRFTYVLPGYEGSANDGTVLRKAVAKGFAPPTSRSYYLADGGYSKNNRMLLVPYQKTRYHLREFKASKQKPATPEELFNLRHAQFRNCIERLFGITKLRWPVLRDGPHYGFNFKMQRRIVVALAALHNFMQDHGQDIDSEPYDWQQTDEDIGLTQSEGVTDFGSDSDPGMVSFRDKIAADMWRDYQRLLRARRDLQGHGSDVD